MGSLEKRGFCCGHTQGVWIGLAEGQLLLLLIALPPGATTSKSQWLICSQSMCGCADLCLRPAVHPLLPRLPMHFPNFKGEGLLMGSGSFGEEGICWWTYTLFGCAGCMCSTSRISRRMAFVVAQIALAP